MPEQESNVDNIQTAMETVLKVTQPPDLKEVVDKANAEREDIYIEHTKHVAVFEVSPVDIATTDGIGGHYRTPVVEGDKDDDGEVINPRTKEGLQKTHVYPTRVHNTPGAVKGGEWVIVSLKDYEKSVGAQQASLFGTMTEAAGLMARAGGTGEEV